jgi:TPR repeat protein
MQLGGRHCALMMYMRSSLLMTGVVAIALLLSCARVEAQIPPETSLYELIDIVPRPAPVTCGCIGSAFALPLFGRDGPLVPMSEPSALAAQRLAEERVRLQHNAEDGLAGNSNASISVAMHLRDSSLAAGVDDRTEEEAARWLYLAAVQEHPDAFMFLGYRSQRGYGVPQSDETAAYWFHQGAVRGNKTAMLALGLRYAAGRGVQQDFAGAVHWWRQAQATPLASRFLGDAYACGLGVDQDPKRAVREYTKAAEAGDISSNLQLGRLYLSGCAAQNDKEAAKALRRAADDGQPDAQIILSQLLLQGRGVAASAVESYYWARLAERRLADNDERLAAASERVKAAARTLSKDEIAGTETLVAAMLAVTAKRSK